MIPDAFKAYPQFINWALIDKGGKKPDKVPIDPLTGNFVDPINPANWRTADEAMEGVALGFGLGFVFSADDPFFFLDIDNCHDGSHWNELANSLCNTFSGSYVEISQSGAGLHIFGTGVYPEHSCRNIDVSLEFYTKDRFVALTGTGATGDASHCPQASIEWLITNYFNPGVANNEVVGTWTTGPCEEWGGIKDDALLIEKMLASKNASSAFGGSASIADLWSGDTSHYGGDHSTADAALCQHLAFWTGKDCERIDRLFRQSALCRPKWDEQRGANKYGERTILGSVARCEKVFNTTSTTTDEGMRLGDQFQSIDLQIEWFKGCTYVTDMHRVITPRGQMLKPDQFKALYGGWNFALDNNNGKVTDCPYRAFTQSQGYNFPKVDTTCFRPELPEMHIFEQGGLTLINTWLHVDVDRLSGDITPFINHLEAMLPDPGDREILLSFMASAINNPGKKIPWFPIIQGCQGNGKSMLMKVMEHAIGERYCHRLNAADLAKNGLSFNLWIQNKLFIGIEEIYVPKRREVIESLKTFITDDRIEIQGKGDNQYTGDNRANFFACTNHKDGVPKQKGDRRHCIFFTAQQSEQDMINLGWKTHTGNSTKYFSQLYDWLNSGGYAMVTDYLYKYQVRDELNPFTTATTAPITSSTIEAINASLGSLEQDIMEAIAEGRPGFVKPWISSFALSKMLDERRDSKKIPHNKRKEILQDLGYHYHPALKAGRSPSVLPTEGGKPRLYVVKGSIADQIEKPTQVVDEFLKCQSKTDTVNPTAEKFNQGQ